MPQNVKLVAKNRKALFDHTLLEKYIAGIVLKGYEVKAIKEGKASFEGSYVEVKNNILLVKNLNIGRYSKQSNEFNSSSITRDRILLLNKKEIAEIKRETNEKGKTAVPLSLVLMNGKIKMEVGVVKGKKEYEKKQVTKDKQIRRDLDRQVKSLGL